RDALEEPVGVGAGRFPERPGARVLDNLCDSVGSVLLVGPDHATPTALDPAAHVLAAVRARLLIAHAAADVPDQSALFVERDIVDRTAAVADRAQHQSALDLLELIRGYRTQPATPVGLDLVAHHLHRSDRPMLTVAQQRDGRSEEAQADAMAATRRPAVGELAQQPDVAPGRGVR